MKLETIRKLRTLLMSNQLSITGDQFTDLAEIFQALGEEEILAVRRECAPPVHLGDDEDYLAVLSGAK